MAINNKNRSNNTVEDKMYNLFFVKIFRKYEIELLEQTKIQKAGWSCKMIRQKFT